MKTAIIIPYKNRKQYLDLLLVYLPKYLQINHPEIDYDIIISEQLDDSVFNKSLSLNVSIKYCSEVLNSEHLIIHNVDMIPVSKVNYGYRGFCLVWFTDAAGINCLTSDMLKANGYDNTFKGWGDEDVDVIKRLDFYKIPIKDWKDIAPSEKPILSNLEWSGYKNSEELSKRYWGQEWPRFITPEEHNLPSVRINKQHNWFEKNYIEENHKKLIKYSSLDDELRQKHYQSSGLNQIDLNKLEKVCRIEIKNRFHKISYNTTDILQ